MRGQSANRLVNGPSKLVVRLFLVIIVLLITLVVLLLSRPTSSAAASGKGKNQHAGVTIGAGADEFSGLLLSPLPPRSTGVQKQQQLEEAPLKVDVVAAEGGDGSSSQQNEVQAVATTAATPVSMRPARKTPMPLVIVNTKRKTSSQPPSMSPVPSPTNPPRHSRSKDSSQRAANERIEPMKRSQDVHALPLPQSGVAAALRGNQPEADTARILSDNRIAQRYKALPALADTDPIRSSIFTGDSPVAKSSSAVFEGRPALRAVLEKWIVMNRDMRSGQRPARFVTVNPVGQLCNRLMAITSAFVFALITGRGLQIDDSGFYCALSDLFKEPGFDWVGSGRASVDIGHTLMNPESGVWEEMEPLLCQDFDDAYPHPSIHFSINQYLVPYIATNPTYREALIELFGGDDIFTPAAHFLFRPIDELISMRDHYVEEHFNRHFVVGLQVRSGSDFTDNFMSAKDWALYERCALGVAPKAIASNGLKFFIATDTPQGRSAASEHFGADRVIFGPGEFLLSNNPKGVQMALLDLLLLAAANDRVTTAWSSYGYFAAGYSGLAAAIVVDQVDPSAYIAPKGKEQRFMGVPHKSDKRKQCVRLPVHQPCFHKYASWGAAKATCFKKEWFDREMLNGRYC